MAYLWKFNRRFVLFSVFFSFFLHFSHSPYQQDELTARLVQISFFLFTVELNTKPELPLTKAL